MQTHHAAHLVGAKYPFFGLCACLQGRSQTAHNATVLHASSEPKRTFSAASWTESVAVTLLYSIEIESSRISKQRAARTSGDRPRTHAARQHRIPSRPKFECPRNKGGNFPTPCQCHATPGPGHGSVHTQRRSRERAENLDPTRRAC